MCFSFYYENHDEAEFLYLLSPLSRVLCYIINDYLEQLLCLLYENMMNDAQTGNITGHNTIASALTNIVTGKEDANFSSPNGKYNFFTCSSNTLKCDEYAFNASSILIAGNGEFNVKHYTGKFNAYQRTYVLMDFNSLKDYG